MFARAKLMYVLAALLPLASAGCIVIRTNTWHWRTVWTDVATERVPIDTADLQALTARTHNGSISFDGQIAGTPEAWVVFNKKGGGRTVAEAEEALEAIRVHVKPAGSGAYRIGWKWDGVKHHTWHGQVGFEIHAPGNLRFDGETHNGSLNVKGVSGDVRVVTHNGQVTVDSSDGKLYAQTHNGGIEASYAGSEVTLITHNGHVAADLNRCASVSARIETHNGGVKVAVGEDTSGCLTGSTHNGTIQCDLPLSELKASRRELTGTMGSGEGDIEVTTHNGSIRIVKAEG